MKKSIKILIGIILVVIVARCVFVVFNKKKTAITAEEFKSIMEEKEYTVVETTSQFAEYDFVKKSYIATDGKYKFEFYELATEEDAIEFFNNNKTIFENEEGEASAIESNNGKNYEKISLIKNGKYKCISRIKNTALYINIDTEYEGHLKENLKKLDY